MAEMTARISDKQILDWLSMGKEDCAFSPPDSMTFKTVALLEEIIDSRKLIEQHAAEIAKKDRMLEIAISRLVTNIAECVAAPCQYDFKGLSDDESDLLCKDCWLAWLEKEAVKEG